MGKKHSEETKIKIGNAFRGKKLSKEHVRKIQESRKGYRHSEKTKKKISKTLTGRIRPPLSKQWKEKISKGGRGLKRSKETRIKISNAKKGNKTNFWKGGICPINLKIKSSVRYKLWREIIFERDNWTCQICNKRGFLIHAHHINNFSDYPNLRFDLNNGITLCTNCHRKFHKYYGKRNNTKEQFNKFKNQKYTKGWTENDKEIPGWGNIDNILINLKEIK